jgi:hypothetical protein
MSINNKQQLLIRKQKRISWNLELDTYFLQMEKKHFDWMLQEFALIYIF